METRSKAPSNSQSPQLTAAQREYVSRFAGQVAEPVLVSVERIGASTAVLFGGISTFGALWGVAKPGINTLMASHPAVWELAHAASNPYVVLIAGGISAIVAGAVVSLHEAMLFGDSSPEVRRRLIRKEG